MAKADKTTKENKKSTAKKSKIEIKPQVIKRKLYAKTNSNAGAKSKFDETNEEIIKRTRAGLSKKDRIAGLINDSTYQEWMNAGESDIANGISSQFSGFSFNIKSAEKEFREGLLECIKSKATEDWKAATWLLERSCPDSYKLKDKVDMTSTVEVSQKAILEIPDNGRRTVS